LYRCGLLRQPAGSAVWITSECFSESRKIRSKRSVLSGHYVGLTARAKGATKAERLALANRGQQEAGARSAPSFWSVALARKLHCKAQSALYCPRTWLW
ncbi:MAG: hypothetical protein ACO3NE_11615, partial [Alphaproteobacteria bacterium]